MSWMDPAQWIGFDVESSGTRPEFALQPWSKHSFLTSYATAVRHEDTGKISTEVFPTLGDGVALETHPTEEVFDQRMHYEISALLNYAIKTGKYLVGWNTAFDASWLIKMGYRDEVMRVKWADAMLMWKHLTRIPESDKNKANRKKYGLKEAVAEFLPQHAGYEEAVDFHSFVPGEVAKRRKYNRFDAALTVQLARMFVIKLTAPSRVHQRRALAIEMQSIPLVADQYITGLAVNEEGVTDLGGRLSVERIQLGVELDAYGLTPEVLASPAQLQAKLYDDWELPVVKKTAKGARSTDKDALYELSFLDDRIAKVQRYREIGGLKTKFVDNILASVRYNSDGRTHPTAIIGSTYTGRMTYASSILRNKDKRQTGFAIHQMKRAAEYRRNIEAPEGYGICEWDAASQEFRWCAIEANDPVMLGLCEPGEDAHAYMGSQMSDWEYRALQHAAAHGDKEGKLVRQSGKVGNLSCVEKHTRILTDTGYKHIVDVLVSDRVWDGAEFVSHSGVIYNGHRKIITYQGLQATPDHKVSVQGRWVAFECAAENRWAIDRGDVGDRRGGVVSQGWERLRHAALRMWGSPDSGYTQRCRGPVYEVQVLCQQGSSQGQGALSTPNTERCAPAETCQRDVPALQQPQRPVVPQLRGAWSRISLRLREARRGVASGELAARVLSWCGYRSRRQQWALCAGQPAACDAPDKPTQHAHQHVSAVGWEAHTPAGVVGESLLTHLRRTVRKCWHVRRRNNRTGVGGGSREAQELAWSEKEVAVYDILNCGPRNRFVANGLIVHNCQFRIGPKSLLATARTDYQLPWDMAMSTKVHSTYHRSYKGVKKYWERKIKEAKISGYAETLAGRRVLLDGNWHGPSAWQLESTAINFPIQGVGADQKYLAMMCIKPLLTKFGGYFYFELHDGLYAIFPLRKLEKAARAGRELLSNLPYHKAWGFDPPIPLPWDLKMGIGDAQNWGDMQEVE